MEQLRIAGADGLTARQLAINWGLKDCRPAMTALARCQQLYPDEIRTSWRAVEGIPAIVQELRYTYVPPTQEFLR